MNVIYTSGKVGSTTMVHTLRALRPHESTYTVRRLTEAGIAEHKAFRPIVSDDEEVAALLTERPNEAVRLITITRDPVAAAVSSFFYNAEHTHPAVDLDSVSPEWLVDRISGGAGSSNPMFHTDWFDLDYLPTTGIDVYATPFDPVRRFSIATRDRFRSLVLRLEDLDNIGPRALQELLGLPASPTLASRANTGRGNAYAGAYRRFLDVVIFPEVWVEMLYATNYARHFYTDDELARWSRRWSGA